MKMFIKNSYLFLIFFILFFSKPFLCGLIAPNKEINIDSLYIQKLEKEVETLKVIDKSINKTSGIYGRVLYQNPYKYNDELVVAVKTDDIVKNNYVISNEGLIGVIDAVYENFAIVKMLLSKDILLQVKVNDCYGLMSYKKELLLKNINNYCNVKQGDKVYTSNLGYQDEEVLIGSIQKINYDQNEINNTYVINPAANFNDLNYVVVLKGGS